MHDPDLNQLAQMWNFVDPLPQGLIARMQTVAAVEAELVASDLDYELMVLIERSTELAGARGTAAYTLRFAYDDVDLLVRAAGRNGVPVTRLDGWIVPPGDIAVRAQFVSKESGSDTEFECRVDANGRFELSELPTGLVRLWLIPGGEAKPFATPTFEI